MRKQEGLKNTYFTYALSVRIVGILGTLACTLLFFRHPSFPTPDKIFILLIFVFMIFGQAWQMIKRLAPFIGILLVYESFRGIAHSLNSRVHYMLMPKFDEYIFKTLPTITLQRWLWHGQVMWYDFVFYGAYMLHFVLPIALAILVWKLREKYYWRLVTTYLLTSFIGFFIFLVFPAAPPWLASEKGYIPHIVRVSSEIYSAMGIQNFPSIYNRISPNPVAAVPSLHTAYSILFSLFIFKLFGKKWGSLSVIYPLLIITGIVYTGEHYVFDVITGIIVAVIGYLGAPHLLSAFKKSSQKMFS